jgi:hypothetical protein
MRGSRSLSAVFALTMVVGAPLSLRAQEAGAATTPSPRASSGQSRGMHDGRARPQGFSVVLVLGDLRAVAGEEDVPPAARKALTDMKDFLPYRTYRLLDAAWLLCCNSNRAVTRLRGPDDHDYELEIESGAIDQTRLAVKFLLRDLSSAEPSKASTMKSTRVADLEKRVVVIKAQLEEVKKGSTPRHPEVTRLETELQATLERLNQARAAERLPDGDIKPRESIAQSKFGDRSIMNTSFTMDVGETVVVGTSRLSGNSKALIALLTAVPPKTAR